MQVVSSREWVDHEIGHDVQPNVCDQSKDDGTRLDLLQNVNRGRNTLMALQIWAFELQLAKNVAVQKYGERYTRNQGAKQAVQKLHNWEVTKGDNTKKEHMEGITTAATDSLRSVRAKNTRIKQPQKVHNHLY